MHIFRFLFLFLILCSTGAYAARDIPPCLVAVGNDTDAFVKPLKTEILKGKEFSQKLADKSKEALYRLVAGNVMTHCYDVDHIADFNTDIVDPTNIYIPFKMDGKYYQLKVDVANLFDHIDLPTAILVTNMRDRGIGDAIKKSEITQDYFFSGDCSDHWVRINIDNKVPVNKAGQTAFPSYAGQEFFLDFPVGKNNRAFPGLVIAAKKGVAGAEQVVWYLNYRTARENAKAFVTALQNTACANDKLVVDVVSIAAIPVTKNGKTKFATAGGIAGGTMVTLGVLGATIAKSAGTGFWGAIHALAPHPVAWIIAGIAVAGGGAAYAIAPKSLADMNEVLILDGPYIIK